MVSQKSIDLLSQLVTQTQANLDAYTEVLNALNTQLTTDQSQIDQAVSDQVSAVLNPIQDSITSKLTSLANAQTTTTDVNNNSGVAVPVVDSTPAVTP